LIFCFVIWLLHCLWFNHFIVFSQGKCELCTYDGCGPFVVVDHLENKENMNVTPMVKDNLIVVCIQNKRTTNVFVPNFQDDLAIWEFAEMIEIMSRYDRRSSIITNICGHQFQNPTNCSITFSNLDPSIVVSLLCTLVQFLIWQCLFWFTFTCELFSNKTSKIVSNFISNIDDHWLNVNQNFHDLLSNLVMIRCQLIFF